MPGGGKGTPVLKICVVCELEFYARPHARTCGDRCRKILQRREQGVIPASKPGDTADIYILKERDGNIYYVGSTLTRAAARGHVLPPGAESIIIAKVPAEDRYKEEQRTLDSLRIAGHTLVNKNRPLRSGKWK